MSHSRRWLEVVVGPRLDAVLARVDRSVGVDTHIGRARQILAARGPLDPDSAEGSLRVAVVERCRADLFGRPAPAPIAGRPELRQALSDAFQDCADGSRELERIVHLIGLVPDVVNLDAEFGQQAPPFEAAGRPAEHRVAARIWAGLAASAIPRDHAVRCVENFVAGRSEASWFLKRGALYGGASALRALIRVARLEPVADAPARRLCNRLLRHVEIRRDHSLQFRAEDLPDGATPALERVRFTLALLDAASAWSDLRYLNAALKLNDWRHLERRTELDADSVLLGHAACIAAQERVLRELLGQ